MTYLPLRDHEPDYDGMWAEIESLDAASIEAIERANGGPVILRMDLSSDYVDRLALSRVRALVINDIHHTGAVVRFVDLRQSASETPIQFVRRIVTAYCDEALTE